MFSFRQYYIKNEIYGHKLCNFIYILSQGICFNSSCLCLIQNHHAVVALNGILVETPALLPLRLRCNRQSSDIQYSQTYSAVGLRYWPEYITGASGSSAEGTQSFTSDLCSSPACTFAHQALHFIFGIFPMTQNKNSGNILGFYSCGIKLFQEEAVLSCSAWALVMSLVIMATFSPAFTSWERGASQSAPTVLFLPLPLGKLHFYLVWLQLRLTGYQLYQSLFAASQIIEFH